jgi:hypothetical protein
MGVNFGASLKTFVAASPWLTDEDAPALMTLEAIAAELDGGNHQAAMFAQWGLAYRALVARKPVADTEPDEFERLLTAGAGDGDAHGDPDAA